MVLVFYIKDVYTTTGEFGLPLTSHISTKAVYIMDSVARFHFSWSFINKKEASNEVLNNLHIIRASS